MDNTYTLFTLPGKVEPLVTVNLNSVDVSMELDTGASLSIISEETFCSIAQPMDNLQPTKLDLSQAYQQLPLHSDSKKFTTINTHKGLFQYEHLPFGISTAPSIFQRLMESLLCDLPNVCVYIDDILISGKTEGDHLRNLELVLSQLSSAGITLKRSKCIFATTSVEYLGHIIDNKGLHPSL